MYRNDSPILRVWLLAAAVAAVVAVGILYLPHLLLERLRLDLYYAPGDLFYRSVFGEDFEGGTAFGSQVVVLGGTTVGWATLVAVLWWAKAKFDSLLAYVAFVGALIAVAVFATTAFGLLPR